MTDGEARNEGKLVDLEDFSWNKQDSSLKYEDEISTDMITSPSIYRVAMVEEAVN